MCHKLLQKYGCGCTKELCTTACPHALATSTVVQPQQQSHQQSQAPYPISSPKSSAHQSQPQPQPLRITQRVDSTSSIQTISTTTAATNDDLPAYNTNHVSSSAAHTTLPSQRPVSLSTLQHSPSTPSTQSQPSPTSPLPVQTTSLSTTFPGTNIEVEMKPKYCAYFFARNTPQSKRPCLQCYMKDEYREYRARWMNEYRGLHPGTRPEDLARMAGVEGARERAGRGEI